MKRNRTKEQKFTAQGGIQGTRPDPLAGTQRLRAISTARLRASPPVHLPPINVLVSDGPVRPHLAAGFALRCIQRLSDPGLDTLRCAWRHNRSTSGRSVTVLSY